MNKFDDIPHYRILPAYTPRMFRDTPIRFDNAPQNSSDLISFFGIPLIGQSYLCTCVVTIKLIFFTFRLECLLRFLLCWLCGKARPSLRKHQVIIACTNDAFLENLHDLWLSMEQQSRPPRRRNRGRRGGGGGPTSGNASSPTLMATSNIGANDSPRRRAPRKNRRGQKVATLPRSESPERAGVKVVVRRLPPRLTAEEYFSSALGSNVAVWKSYNKGASSKHSTRTSTAHLAFANNLDAAKFFQLHNGTRLCDAKTGTEYIARVERALFQVVPKYGPKKQVLAGTIEADGHYKRFLEALQQEQNDSSAPLGPVPPKPKAKGPQPITVSKLMEDVRARRKSRDNKKAGKATAGGRSARRRGRKAAAAAAAAAAGANSTTPAGKPILLKKSSHSQRDEHAQPAIEKKKSGRPTRAQKRAAAQAAAAANAPGNEGDGVYVVRVSKPVGGQRNSSKPAPNSVAANALALAAARGEAGGNTSPAKSTPRRKGKRGGNGATSGNGGGPPPFGSPGRPIRLLKKETVGGPPSGGGNGT